jgi:hypothetical protein
MNHYNSAPSPIVQRYKFNMRMKKPGESVAKYVAALKALGEHCAYGEQLNHAV